LLLLIFYRVTFFAKCPGFLWKNGNVPFFKKSYGNPNLYTVGGTLWTVDNPVARPLPTHRTIQTQNKRTQTSMPQVGFELTISVFEGTKMVHALDRAATVIGWNN
jgi:hypothetical protein